MLRKLFAGELTVTQTYWGGFVGFNFLMRGVFIAITAGTFELYVNEQDWLADGIMNFAIVVGIVYCLLLARGQYRAMNNDRVPSFWSWAGLVIILLGSVGYGYNLFTFNSNGLPIGRKAIRNEVLALNLSMPSEVSQGIIAERVAFENGLYQIVYSYAFDDLEPGRVNMFDGPDADEMCREFSGYFRGPVKVLEFIYNGPAHTTTVFMTKEECLSHINDG
ncbi:hypothetical protein K3X41_04960 [Aliiroseovarius crassostreae]|uniref:hypothetical protein n=1 Tax=Aliiroseovarius crassostreae TaxID=154981 RepID=UPI0021FD289C|nr:hypothetical protein [Aliiroseovarius crassostreae]UWQ12032.1 hypothetical protein K3X41_04960 [Aliiroseovarius crassostreae]